MKKTLIALLALSGVACGATTIITPFTDSSYGTWTGGGTVSSENNSYTGTEGEHWGGDIATYTLTDSILLSNPEDTLTFSYVFENSSSGNNVLTLALLGDENVIVTGKGVYNWKAGAQAIYEECGEYSGFVMADGNTNSTIAKYTVSSTDNITGAVPVGESVTLSGTIAWNEDSEIFQLVFSSDKVSGTSLTVDLGKTVDIDKVVLTSASNAANKATISNLSLTVNTVPEPATASLSLLGLAALMIRRRR